MAVPRSYSCPFQQRLEIPALFSVHLYFYDKSFLLDNWKSFYRPICLRSRMSGINQSNARDFLQTAEASFPAAEEHKSSWHQHSSGILFSHSTINPTLWWQGAKQDNVWSKVTYKRIPSTWDMDIAVPPSYTSARAQTPPIMANCPPKYNENLIILRNNCFLDFRPVVETAT